MKPTFGADGRMDETLAVKKEELYSWEWNFLTWLDTVWQPHYCSRSVHEEVAVRVGKRVRNRKCLIRSRWQQFVSLRLIIWKKVSLESISELKNAFWKWQESTNPPFFSLHSGIQWQIPCWCSEAEITGWVCSWSRDVEERHTKAEESDINRDILTLSREHFPAARRSADVLPEGVTDRERCCAFHSVWSPASRERRYQRASLSQLFTLMKLDIAADRMRNIQLSGYIPGFFFCIHSEVWGFFSDFYQIGRV